MMIYSYSCLGKTTPRRYPQVPRLVEDGPERSWPKVGLQDHGSWPWKDSSTMLVYLPLGWEFFGALSPQRQIHDDTRTMFSAWRQGPWLELRSCCASTGRHSPRWSAQPHAERGRWLHRKLPVPGCRLGDEDVHKDSFPSCSPVQLCSDAVSPRLVHQHVDHYSIMKCVAQLKMLKWDNITGTLRYPVEISGFSWARGLPWQAGRCSVTVGEE